MATAHAALIRSANARLLVAGELSAIDEYFAPDYVAHGTGRSLAGGHDLVRRFLDPLRRAFTALEVEVEILVESKDRVAWQRTLRGTHRAAYKGFPASGRQLVWRDMVTSRFRGGRIAEDWVITDLAEQLLRARKTPAGGKQPITNTKRSPDMDQKPTKKQGMSSNRRGAARPDAPKPGADIAAYDASRPAREAAICRRLRTEIAATLPDATSKVWHGAPVWFVGETPVVGYSVPARGGVALLFWNGQAFDEPALHPMGKFQAAQVDYGSVEEIEVTPLRRWLRKAGKQLWDVSVIRARRAAASKKKRTGAAD